MRRLVRRLHSVGLAALGRALIAAAIAGVLAAPPARADEPAAPDTTLEGFLGGLSDSTDRYFGLSAEPPDTTGNDSALVFALEHPRYERTRRKFGYSIWPDFAFNRVDGPVWGGRASIGRPQVAGQLYGVIGYAAGPNDWLGGGGVRRALSGPHGLWSLDVFAGRMTANMERERSGRHLASMRALVAGKDHRHYYRRDGVESSLGLENQTWRAGIGYRDQLESPQVTTTTWNFAKRVPSVVDNLPATLARVRELEFGAAWALPFVPLTAEASHQTSGAGIGSDLEYRRVRVALSGDFGAGSYVSVVPQFVYGRLGESLVPQEAFYLGGAHSLRSLPGAALGGTGLALARIDLIEAPDILELAHIPHPAAFPLQIGVFGAIGAVWGADPYGGPTVAGRNWPERRSWMSEVGASLIYQPGIPDPTTTIRLNFAEPLGPGREATRWTITVSRAIDLVRPLGD